MRLCYDSARQHGLSTPVPARHVEGTLGHVRADYRKKGFVPRRDQSKFQSPRGVNDAKVQQDNSMATLNKRTNERTNELVILISQGAGAYRSNG